MPGADAGFEILGSASDGAGGWILTARVAADSPLFAGHFPAHPIVPGVAFLALVSRAAADWHGGEGRLESLRGFKLRRPVGPGETLSLRLQRRPEPSLEVSFEIRGADGEGPAIASGHAGLDLPGEVR